MLALLKFVITFQYYEPTTKLIAQALSMSVNWS